MVKISRKIIMIKKMPKASQQFRWKRSEVAHMRLAQGSAGVTLFLSAF